MPGRSVMGVGMKSSQMNKAPPGGTQMPGNKMNMNPTGNFAAYAEHGPILEAVKRRSKLADPGGAGEVGSCTR